MARFQFVSLKVKLFGVTVLVLLAVMAWNRAAAGGGEQLGTQAVKRGTIVETITETGNVQSDDVAVYSAAAGSVSEIYVENGRPVKKGDDLFKVEAAATDAENVVEAPVDGIVANIAIEVGNQVPGGNVAANPAATPVLLIGKGQARIVKVSLAEGDINKVKKGQIATVSISAIKDTEFTGSVLRTDEIGTNTSGVITYDVYIKLDDADAAIKPLMSATANIETARRDSAMLVPNAAVRPYRGGKGVQVLESKTRGSGRTRMVIVKTGIKSSSETEIIAGLSKDQRIVIGGTLPPAQVENSRDESRESFLKRIWVNHMGGNNDER